MADNTNPNKDLTEAIAQIGPQLSQLKAAIENSNITELTKAIDTANTANLSKYLKDFSTAITQNSVLKTAIDANTRAINSLVSKVNISSANQNISGAQSATNIKSGINLNTSVEQRLDKIIQLLSGISTAQNTASAQAQANGTVDPNQQQVAEPGFWRKLFFGFFNTRKYMWAKQAEFIDPTTGELKKGAWGAGGVEHMGHYLSKALPTGARDILGGVYGYLSAGAGALSAIGFTGIALLASQFAKIFSDHIMSIPKSWATLKQAQVLSGTFDWDTLSKYANDNNTRNNNPLITAYAGNKSEFAPFHFDYRFRAGRMGYDSSEFYNRYLDFVGAGIKGPNGAATSAVEQYLMPALAIERATGGQVKFTTDFLSAINKSTSSTFSLEKHIQLLDATMKQNVYVSEKQLQAVSNALAVGVRGNVGNGNEFYARALSMVAPAINANLLTEQEAAGLLQASKGLSFEQRARLAAFIPALQGKGILGGAQTLLENSATMEGQTQNLEYFVQMARAMTGGRKFMSMTDDERAMATLLLEKQGLPSQLVGSAVFGKLVDNIATSKDKEEAIDLMKSPTLKQLEANAQGIAALEDPLKQIRDTVVGWALDGFNWFRGGIDPSVKMAIKGFSFTGMEGKEITNFSLRDYEKADMSEKKRLIAQFNAYQDYLASKGHERQSFNEIYLSVKAQEESNKKLDEVNSNLQIIANKISGARVKTAVAGSDSNDVDTTSSNPEYW